MIKSFRDRDAERLFRRERVRRPSRRAKPARRRQLRKLKIYAGSEHPHAAQKPQEFPLAVSPARRIDS